MSHGKKSLISLFIGTATILVGCYVPQPQPEVQHPILKRQGVEIIYPSNWRSQAYYDTPPVDNPDAPAEPRKSPTFFNAVEVMDFFPGEDTKVRIELDIEKLPRPMTLEEAYTEVVNEKLKIYSNKNRQGDYHTSILKEPKPVKLNSGQEAYEFIYSKFNGKHQVKGKVVFALKQQPSDQLYIFHYQAPEAQYEQYLKEVDSVIQSWKLVPKDTMVSLTREDMDEVFKEDKFFCGEGFNENGEAAPTILADHHWGNIPIMRFEDSVFKDWPPQKRCEEIARRLTDFYHRGLLVHLEVGYLPKSILDAAKIYLRENSGFSLAT